MGGLVNKIFGGGSTKQGKRSLELQERMHEDTMGLVKPYAEGGVRSFDDYNAFLRGGPEQEKAFQNWLNSSDYGFVRDAGMDAITSNAAARGLRGSGATMKAYGDFASSTANRYRQNFMDNVFRSADLGVRAAGAASSANQANADAQAQTRQQIADGKKQGFGNFLNFGLAAAGIF